MSEKILDRLRTERQLALNGDKQIMARSFDMAISEIERLREALEEIKARDWYWGAPFDPVTNHNTRHQGLYGKIATNALGGNEQAAAGADK